MIDINEVDTIEVDGVDSKDYPDFCDAYISYAWNVKKDRECTDMELEILTEENLDLVNELAYDSLL
jgi:hypothetical protein